MLAKFHPRAFVTLAGFLSNIVTKGTMKSVGFILKAIKEQNPKISTTMAVLFPSFMHLFFNCFSKFLYKLVRMLNFSKFCLLGLFWQYSTNKKRLWSFQTGGTKLERFLPKNQQLPKWIFWICRIPTKWINPTKGTSPHQRDKPPPKGS